MEALTTDTTETSIATIAAATSVEAHVITDQAPPQAVAEVKKTYLADYMPPVYRIPTIDLRFDLDAERTIVRSKMTITTDEPTQPLVLNGEDVELLELYLDGEKLTPNDYVLDDKTLTLHPGKDKFTLTVVNAINPKTNLELSGLYESKGLLTTQCEATGFRRMTYYIDRPDVMPSFETTLVGDPTKYPVMISNGDMVREETLDDGRVLRTYSDPWPKPGHLFAIVAGDLAKITDTFTTGKGREVMLEFYCVPGNEDRLDFAIESLKKAMVWDENKFLRYYDLDTLRVAAVPDFNAGAMENKGLLIFNDSCLLGCPRSASDSDLKWIEGVIAHEYFHNWSGNRVTIRDWFQLALKEGWTSKRNQDFSSDMNSKVVERIQVVRVLRSQQFPEDAGPTAHPVLPKEYTSPDDNYTRTTYRKGAEVCRVLENVVGEEKYVKGIIHYFDSNDGKACTILDVLSAVEESTGEDLTQFQLWFDQAGTPEVKVTMDYDEEKQEARLHVSQYCRPTAECQDKKPFLIPMDVGFIDTEGNEVVASQMLRITGREQTFVFPNVPARPIPSLFRHFSAPVKVDYPYTKGELCTLLAHDTDGFNRYEAGHRLAMTEMTNCFRALRQQQSYQFDSKVIDALHDVLLDSDIDEAIRAEVLTLPTVDELIGETNVYDYQAAISAKNALRDAIAQALEPTLLATVVRLGVVDGQDGTARGQRSLRNLCLGYLASFDDHRYHQLIVDQWDRSADNYNDSYAALSMLCDYDSPERNRALQTYYSRWKDTSSVVNDFFLLQSTSDKEGLVDEVRALEDHDGFDKKNPNALYSLFRGFARNVAAFHHPSGSGYAYIAEKIADVDQYNKSMSCRLGQAFKSFPNLVPQQQELMRPHLVGLLANDISDGLRGVVTKILEGEKE